MGVDEDGEEPATKRQKTDSDPDAPRQLAAWTFKAASGATGQAIQNAWSGFSVDYKPPKKRTTKTASLARSRTLELSRISIDLHQASHFLALKISFADNNASGVRLPLSSVLSLALANRRMFLIQRINLLSAVTGNKYGLVLTHFIITALQGISC